MAGDSVLLDVADAVASGQAVDWDRARRAAPPEHRRSLGNLRALSGMFGSVGPGTPGRGGAAASGDQPGTAFARFALRALVAAAAVPVAAGMAALPWSWDRGVDPEVAAPGSLVLVFLSACALLLFAGGRRDHRARLLGAAWMVGASSFSFQFAGVQWVRRVLPEVFLPALMWAFAREFPRVYRRSSLDDLARRMVPISAAIGGALWIANLPPLTVWLPFLRRSDDGGVYWIPIAILVLAAVAAVGWRARDAAAEESRRVTLLIGGIVVGVAPIFIYITIALLWPAARRLGEEHLDVVYGVVFTGILSIPCSTTYAVLVDRALDVRTVVRASYRRLLTRRVLAVTIAAPLGALVWLFASQSDRTVAAVMASSPARLLVAASGAAALAAGCRRRLLVRLDAWVYPETAEHRRLLVNAGSELARAASASQVGEVVAGSARRGCGALATLVVADENDRRAPSHFTSPVGAVPPLARTAAIAHVLESTREPMHVDPDDRRSTFAVLPEADAEWVVAGEVALVTPILGPGSEVLGIVAVGRRFDDRRLSAVDLDFLQALAGTAGLALGRVRLGDAADGGTVEAPPATECPACGIVGPSRRGRPCGCGVDPVAAPVPAVLAGKFSLERLLGSGGMGAVYLARDLGLQRYVAVKALPAAAVRGLSRLTQEARAMAAVAHPAIAQIHGLETWRGRPLLVVEFLPGGTLAARLARGPLPGAEAVGVALTLTEALTALHEAGYVHGDLKPSNVGFASDGSAKLLDFGLARLTDDNEEPAGGTLSYLSPEVLRGARMREADDVWSLCVVFYEMVAGRHPFAGDGADEIADRIRGQRIRAAAGAGEAAASRSLARAAAAILTAGRPARPATARAFADVLDGL